MPKENTNIADICSTIHSADKIDPFEGLDLDEICVSPNQINEASAQEADSNELFELNPLDDIDLEGLSVNPYTVTGTQTATGIQSQSQNKVNFVIIPGKESDEEEVSKKQHFKRPVRSLSKDTSRPPVKQKQAFINPIIEKAYHYAELTQIREKVFSSLEESGGNTLLIASPHDNTGSSLLAVSTWVQCGMFLSEESTSYRLQYASRRTT